MTPSPGHGCGRSATTTPGNGDDEASSVAVSPGGTKVFVTGGNRRNGAGVTEDYATVAYRASTGARLWVKRHNGRGNGPDAPAAMSVSPERAMVFVTGSSWGPTTAVDYATVAYSAVTGARKWVKRYHGPQHAYAGDDATSVSVSPNGSSVFVTGSSWGGPSSVDYATVAYRAGTGAREWVQRYNGPGNLQDEAASVGVSPRGTTVFVTGSSDSSAEHGDSTDYATVAYSAADGAKRWVSRYNGPGNLEDEAVALAASPKGAKVFVTGISVRIPTRVDFATVAYNSANGRQRWVERYNGGSESVIAESMAVNRKGTEVFVTGYSSDDLVEDYATVAYRG
jgi:hypothetical protein